MSAIKKFRKTQKTHNDLLQFCSKYISKLSNNELFILEKAIRTRYNVIEREQVVLYKK